MAGENADQGDTPTGKGRFALSGVAGDECFHMRFCRACMRTDGGWRMVCRYRYRCR